MSYESSVIQTFFSSKIGTGSSRVLRALLDHTF